ncbi:MAG: hypothetical protein AAF497_12645, partial [Planctomycetota bacterium]
ILLFRGSASEHTAAAAPPPGFRGQQKFRDINCVAIFLPGGGAAAAVCSEAEPRNKRIKLRLRTRTRNVH